VSAALYDDGEPGGDLYVPEVTVYLCPTCQTEHDTRTDAVLCHRADMARMVDGITHKPAPTSAPGGRAAALIVRMILAAAVVYLTVIAVGVATQPPAPKGKRISTACAAQEWSACA